MTNTQISGIILGMGVPSFLTAAARKQNYDDFRVTLEQNERALARNTSITDGALKFVDDLAATGPSPEEQKTIAYVRSLISLFDGIENKPVSDILESLTQAYGQGKLSHELLLLLNQFLGAFGNLFNRYGQELQTLLGK